MCTINFNGSFFSPIYLHNSLKMPRNSAPADVFSRHISSHTVNTILDPSLFSEHPLWVVCTKKNCSKEEKGRACHWDKDEFRQHLFYFRDFGHYWDIMPDRKQPKEKLTVAHGWWGTIYCGMEAWWQDLEAGGLRSTGRKWRDGGLLCLLSLYSC